MNKKVAALRDGIILIVICAVFAVVALALNDSADTSDIFSEKMTTVQDVEVEETTVE